MQKIKDTFILFRKKKKYFYTTLIVLLLIILVLLFKNGNGQEQTIIAKIGDFKNQVSISGKVIPSSNVELGFKNSGRVERVYYSQNSSEFVKTGSLLAQIEAKEARKDLHDAEINLAEAKLALTKFLLENSNQNMDTDLQQAYDDGFSAMSEAFLNLSPVIDDLDDILTDSNVSGNVIISSGRIATNYKDEAESFYFKADKTFKKNQKDFQLLNRDSLNEDIEKNIDQIYETTKIIADATKSTKNLVDYLAKDTNNDANYTDFKDTLSEDTNTVNEHLSDLLSVKTAIKNAKDSFQNTDLNVQSLELSIKQKENALEEAKSTLEDYYIRAPFDGIITKIDAKVGEIVSSNTPLISMMSKDTFQIESYVPEINIAQIKIGDEASITLDAYGESVVFFAKVIFIDPAETIRNGVSTYKTKFQFSSIDDRIKSGMTANVSVITFNKSNVITMPGGVIFDKDGKKFVQLKNGDEILDREVVLGNVSSLGQVEIVSGLENGDVVILNPN